VPGCLTALVGLLSSSSQGVQEAAAGAIHNLALNNDANQSAIAAVRAFYARRACHAA